MKIDDLKTAEWDGTWEIIWESEGKKILLLNLINMIELNENGRRNLIEVDERMNILWIAEAPKISRSFGWFHKIKYLEGRLKGWYGFSVWVELDPLTGNLINEQFIK